MANQTLAQIVIASPTSALDGTEKMYFLQSGGDTGGAASLIKTYVLAGASAGTILAGATPAFTATPVLGVAGATVGTIGFENATSGRITLSPPTGALGTVTCTLPLGGTLATLAGTESLSNKTLVAPILGTPASGTLTNCTLPVGGVTGLGTGVATALAVNVGSAGAPVVLNGALGTPSSGTLTNATGLPAAGVVGTAAIIGANTFTALQTITQASANAGIIASTGYSLTGSDATSMASLTGTINTSGSPDIIKIAITDTARGASTKWLNIYGGAAGASSLFSLDRSGNVIAAGSFTGAAGSSSALTYGFTGASGYGIYQTGTSIVFYANAFAKSFGLNNVSNSLSLPAALQFGFVSATDPTAAPDTALGRGSAGVFKFLSANTFSANASTATVLGSVGPSGASTTVQEWLTFQNSSGTVRYVPCF